MSIPYNELKAALILMTNRAGGVFMIRKGADYTYVNVPKAVDAEAWVVFRMYDLRVVLQDTLSDMYVYRLVNSAVTDWPRE